MTQSNPLEFFISEGFLVNLFIDKKSNKVSCAEAGQDLVDFLSKLVSLPFSTIVAYQSAYSGATGKLLQSLEKIDISLANGAVMSNGGQRLETTGRSILAYTIMDDLTINSCSNIHALSLLKNHGGDLEEKLIKVDVTQCMKMLTASLCSDEVITTVFVGKREYVKTVRMDPHGGLGGCGWDDGGCYTGIRQIVLVYGHCIDSIQVDYDLNGKVVQGCRHGGSGGDHTTHVMLQFPEEYLSAVSGYYSHFSWGGSPVIRSLTLKNNVRTWGPFGMETGTPFSVSMDVDSIVGFHGRGGWYLDSLGFYRAPPNRR